MKTHRHHLTYKSRGGSDEKSNLIEIDFITHTEIHARDFINGGPMFDCRHEGWNYLDKNLQNLVKLELSKRLAKRNKEKTQCGTLSH
jgi:hypothetical protein